MSYFLECLTYRNEFMYTLFTKSVVEMELFNLISSLFHINCEENLHCHHRIILPKSKILTKFQINSLFALRKMLMV